MKSLRIIALALLLQVPLSQAGCDGYEDTRFGRNFTPYITLIVFGSGFAAAGMRQISKAANTLWNDSYGTQPLMHNDAALRVAASRSAINNGLIAVGCGTALTLMSFSFLVAGEANARSNCCNALPSNSTCEWNK
jgi:hypothetical protein